MASETVGTCANQLGADQEDLFPSFEKKIIITGGKEKDVVERLRWMLSNENVPQKIFYR